MTIFVVSLAVGYVFVAGGVCERLSAAGPSFDRGWHPAAYHVLAVVLAVVWPVTSLVAWWMMRRPMWADQ